MFTAAFNRFLALSTILFLTLLGLHLFLGKEAAFYLFHSTGNCLFDSTMPWLTYLGNSGVFIFFLAGSYSHSKKLFWHYLISGLLVLLCVELSKYLLWPHAARPAAILPATRLHLLPGEITHRLHSFPSGHTATIFLTCGLLAFHAPNPKIATWLVLPCIVVGYSRIYLAQHWPADIAAGACIALAGIVVGWFILPKSLRQ